MGFAVHIGVGNLDLTTATESARYALVQWTLKDL